MGLTLATGPALEPLTISDVKAQGRIDTGLAEIAPLTAPSLALAGAGAGNVDDGAHRYRVTFVTAQGETEAGVISSAVTVADKTVNGKVSLTAIPIGSARCTARKIYRTAAGGSTYLLLATLSDNSTTIYTDNTADASLGAGAPSTNTTDDPYLLGLIESARHYVERYTHRALITQSWVWTAECFPYSGEIILPNPPIISVEAVKYLDADGTLQTWDAENYVVSLTDDRGRIRPAYGVTWPDTYSHPDAVRVEFTVGYGSAASNVPAPIRHAMQLLVATWYNQREEEIIGTISKRSEAGADMLLHPYVSRKF